MSALRTLVSKADSSLTNVGGSASSDSSTKRSYQPTGAPLARSKPTARGGPFDSRGVVVGARAAKYLLCAVLGVLMAALVACGASGEPTSGEQSGGGAPAPKEAPTDTPIAAQPTSAAASVPTETLAVTAAPAPTIAPTSTPTQAAPTNTPAPTATSAPPPTPTQSVEELIAAITTPGPRVNTEGVWWYREPKEHELVRDYTPQGVYETHPNSEALDFMDGRFQYHELPGVDSYATYPKALEYYVGIARREMNAPFFRDIAEAEGDPGVVRRIPGKEITADFMKTAAWEVVSSEKPVVRYWGKIGYLKGKTGGLKHDYRVGFTVSFDVVDYKPRGLGRYEEYPIDEFLDNPVVSDFVLEAIED